MMEVSAVIAWIVLSVIAAAIAHSLFPRNSALAVATGYVGVVAVGWLLVYILSSIGIQLGVLVQLVFVVSVPALIIAFILVTFSPVFLLVGLGVPGTREEDQPISRREHEQSRRDLEVERRRDQERSRREYQELKAEHEKLKAEHEKLKGE